MSLRSMWGQELFVWMDNIYASLDASMTNNLQGSANKTHIYTFHMSYACIHHFSKSKHRIVGRAPQK